MTEHLKKAAKAYAAALVAAAGYLVGVFPTDGSLFHDLAEMTGVQWLGLVIFMGGAYGITYAVPNKPTGRGR